MQKFLSICLTAIFLMAAVSLVYAGADAVTLKLADINTNDTMSVDTTVPLYGYIIGVEFFVQDTPFTGNVSLVVVTNANYNLERLIYSNAAMTASDEYYVRIPVHDTGGNELGVATNGYEPRMLAGERIQLRASGLNETNKNLISTIKFWDPR